MEWSAEMGRWAESVLGQSGLDFEVIRAMPWAVVARAETSDGLRWVKANHATYAYEAALVEKLAELTPELVIGLIDRHPDTGWFVMHDGGSPAGPAHAAETLAAYRRVQAASLDHVGELLDRGVPDMRPSELGAVFDMALRDPDAAPVEQELQECRGVFDSICARLAADDQATIVNTDMKLEHAFAGPPVRLFDWGDTVITHPLVGEATLRFRFADQMGAAEPTTDLAADADRLAPLFNAAVWLRDPPGARAQWPDRIGYHLGELAKRLQER